MIKMRNLLKENSKKSFIGFHNTTQSSYDSILKNGFKITNNIRGKAFGTGIYFSKEENQRWGDFSIKVEITPKKPLLDYEGNIEYEDNLLGKKIELMGQKLFSDFHMSDGKKREKAIEEFLIRGKYDMLLTQEFGKIIYVVRDPKIIKIISG